MVAITSAVTKSKVNNNGQGEMGPTTDPSLVVTREGRGLGRWRRAGQSWAKRIKRMKRNKLPVIKLISHRDGKSSPGKSQ